MKRRRLGGSDLELSCIGFGAWAAGGLMWGGGDEAAAVRAIETSLDAGVNWIDTAPAYGCGASEELVGRALRGRRHEALIATKCGLRWDRTEGALRFETPDERGRPVRIHHNLLPESLREECEGSLRRLGVEAIDLYQIHWPYAPHSLEDAFAELVRLREEGKVRHLGVSNFTRAELEIAHAAGAIVCLQPPYNLLDRRIEAELLPWCRAHGIGVTPYSSMGRGLLTGAVGLERRFAASDHRSQNPVFAPEHRRSVLAALAEAEPIARRHAASPGNLAVAWLLHQPGVTAALVGARDEQQARENLRAADVDLSDAECRELARIFPELPWAPSKPAQ